MNSDTSTVPRRIVGLTGGIGVGKSTVAVELARLGAHIIDVDKVCRAVIEPGGSAHSALVERFGPGVVTDGGLDRAELAKLVFSEPAALADLTALSHPAANRAMADEIAALEPGLPVVLDMAVLAEYPKLGRWGEGAEGGYQKVILVTAPAEARMSRLEAQRGMDPADAKARMAAQLSDAERRAIADVEIVNDDDLVSLAARVSAAWESVTR